MSNIVITKEQIDEFQTNGVICLRGVFDEHWVQVKKHIKTIVLWEFNTRQFKKKEKK